MILIVRHSFLPPSLRFGDHTVENFQSLPLVGRYHKAYAWRIATLSSNVTHRYAGTVIGSGTRNIKTHLKKWNSTYRAVNIGALHHHCVEPLHERLHNHITKCQLTLRYLSTIQIKQQILSTLSDIN